MCFGSTLLVMHRLFRPLLVSLFVLFLNSISFSPIHAESIDQIEQFTSEITINQDTSLSIQETIEYRTNLDKHGIYRYVPLTYNQGGKKIRHAIKNIRVTDQEGEPINHVQSADGQNLTLKIGDPDVTFTGPKTYVIEYNVDKAVRRFPDHDELYWDITGEGWQIPVLATTARVNSEFADVTKTTCYSGQFGSDDGLCQDQIDSPSQATFTYDQSINYGDNMTVVLTLDHNNQLIFPTATDNLIDWFLQNWILVLIPLPTLLLFTWWWINRDRQFVSANVFILDEHQPQQKKPLQLKAREPFVYEPLKDLSPGEAGALLNEKVDNQDVVAEILELARKKYIKIEEIEVKKLFGNKRDYQLTQLQESKQPLTLAQKFLFHQLFIKGNIVTLALLKGTFYTSMQLTKQKIEQALVNRNIYTSKPSTARGQGITVTFFSLGGLMALTLWQFAPYQIFWPIPILVLQLPICLLLAYNLPQRTAVGTNLWLQTRGLRKTIQSGKWREEVKEKNLFIEEVLPFAVALGVVDRLSSDMKDLNMKPPEYLSNSTLSTFTASQFVSSFSSQVSSNLSYNPSSSSSSGGSGFSGGSSGGGSGGGGGGSW